MVYIEQLTHEALEEVTTQNWGNCVFYAENIQEETMKDTLMEPTILTITPDDSDWNRDKDDDDTRRIQVKINNLKNIFYSYTQQQFRINKKINNKYYKNSLYELKKLHCYTF